jgi:basic membrane lipoprotein Med (substrate-binding protein (PBP1-ABC) superfamily)
LDLVAILALLALPACSIIFDPELREFSEYGARCQINSECASGICQSNRCSESCSNSCEGNAECRSGVCYFLSPPPLDGPPKIGYLFSEDEVASHGMAKTHDDGRAYILSHVAGATAVVKMGIGSAEAAGAIDDLIDEECNVIIATQNDYRDAMQNAANRYPEVNFLLYSNYAGFEPGPNLGAYMGRMYQVMYLMGNLAARITTTGRVGIVGPLAEPESVASVNAFVRGALAYEEEPEVVVRWINYWSNPGLEAQAVEELAEANVDVVLGYTNSTTPLEEAPAVTADGHTLYVIGYGNPNTCNLQPTRCLSAAYWNWGPMLTETIEAMESGEWEPAAVWENITGNKDTSVVFYADFDIMLVSPTHAADLWTVVTSLATDEAYPFVGPVRSVGGTTMIDSGDSPTDADILEMCWHVQGTMQLTDDPLVLEPAEVPMTCRGERDD